MKKTLAMLLLGLLFSNTAFAESYYFKKCKLSNAVSGDYIVNLDKKVIQVNNFQRGSIIKAILKAQKMKNDHKLHVKSIYGDGKSSKRITKLLEKKYPEKIYQKHISY